MTKLLTKALNAVSEPTEFRLVHILPYFFPNDKKGGKNTIDPAKYSANHTTDKG